MHAAVLLLLVLGQAAAVTPRASPQIIVRPNGVHLYPMFSSGFSAHPRLLPVRMLEQTLLAMPSHVWSSGRRVAVKEMAFLPADEPRLAANLADTLAVLARVGLEIDRRPRATATVENAELIELESDGTMAMPQLDEALTVARLATVAASDSQRTLVYYVRLLRMKARRTKNAEERGALTAEATRVWRQAVAQRLGPKRAAPENSSDLSAAWFGERFDVTKRRLHAVEDRHLYPRPIPFWSTEPAYIRRPEQRSILRIIIGSDGVVMNAEMVEGDPKVARTQFEAASLRYYTPPLRQNRPFAWITTMVFDGVRPAL